MKMTNRRIALLTGASVSVFSFAAPAFAATTVVPGTSQSIVDTDVTATIDISNIGDTGVHAVNNPALAIVNSVATGQIRQDAVATGAPGDVDLLMTNTGAAHVGATAIATTTVGNATATAEIFNVGVAQIGSGNGTLDLTIANDGALGVGAVAYAAGTGLAVANATFDGSGGFGYGIYQSAYGGTAGASAIDLAIVNGTAGGIAVHATATANGDTGASANADIDFGVFQIGVAADIVNATIVNDGMIDVEALAAANAETGPVSADANIRVGVVNAAYLAGTGTAEIDNGGLLSVGADAQALAAATGVANAGVLFGIGNTVSAVSGHAVISNSGTMEVHANAFASGDLAAANAEIGGATTFGGSGAGIGQIVNFFGGTVSTATLTNSGAIDIAAAAVANGLTSGSATAVNNGILQQAIGTSEASVALLNDGGSIDITAAAGAAGSAAHADAVANAIIQSVSGGSIASAAVDNSGTISADVTATALGGTAATAIASVYTGIYQSAIATGFADVSIVNSGTFSAHATANALADSGRASASAHVYGFSQSASGGTGSLATIDNSGTINIGLVAHATGSNSAIVHAFGNAVYQDAGSGTAAFFNEGSLSISASDTAVAATYGFAAATALGVAQVASGGQDVFSNDGTIDVAAHAVASASTGAAFAYARGYRAMGLGGTLDVANTGNMAVNAAATAPGTAHALAIGMYLAATATTTAQTAALAGTVVNSGVLQVAALANGGGTFTTATTGGVTTVNLSSATATGIHVNSGVNDLTITNSGTISVDAVTTNGAPATAYGIRVLGAGGGVAPTADDVLTINNDGDIIVRYSTDGGTTFHRGTAIDVTEAPNATVINLLSGNITGDINVQTGDQINVTDGETLFNGVVNAGCFDATAIAAGGDNPALSSCGVGTLAVNNQGNLHLAIDPVDGPSYVFVNTFDMTPLLGGTGPGTLTLDLPATAGTATPGTYPQIFADTANLGGNLVANIQPANGLFDTSFYDNVIDANTRNGTFASCGLAGPFTNSVLLNLQCVYDANANVDLALTRIAFNAVPGLNGNGVATGSGLESVFNIGLTGGVADMFADLFLISDQANYNIALNQLSGSAYANYLQSFPSLGVHYNDLVDHATNCEVPALAGSVLECRASSPIHVWGQLDYQSRKADGDLEAGTTKSKRLTGLLGVDATVGGSAIVGVSGGYVTNHMRDHQFGDRVKGDGWQAGAYAVYDPGSFYVKGVTTYSSLNGDSTRHINFAGLGAGTSFAATPTGSPDVTMWTFGLHGGARFGVSSNSVITPYVNYDYVHAKLKGFDEASGNGADLTVGSGRSNHSFLTGGLKWAGQLGGVVPELNVGYRYRFGSRASSVHEWFTTDPENDFNIVSASQKRGTFLAGLSVGGKLGPVDVRIGYEGEFNSDVTSHSGNFKFVLPLGGHAAPPPPAPVEAPPPPPPPPPATQTCSDGSVILATDSCPVPPPPPPPPAPAPERG